MTSQNRCSRRCAAPSTSSDCGYANPADVGETFARFAAARHGWTVDPGLVHLVPDVMAGVDLILALATEPGDGVVINTPVYPPFFAHISGARRRVVEVPLVRRDGRWDLDFDALEAAFAAGARGYLLCNPHNPSGRVFSAADLRQIATLADRYGVIVLADEIHAPLTLPGARHTPYVRGRRGGRARRHARLRVQGVQRRRAQGRRRGGGLCGHGCPARPGCRRPASSEPGCSGCSPRWRRGSSGDEWLDALIAQLDHARAEFGSPAGAAAARGRVCPPEASYLAWVDMLPARPRPGASAGVPGPRAGGPRRRAQLRPAGRRGTFGSRSAPAAHCWPTSSTGWPPPSADRGPVRSGAPRAGGCQLPERSRQKQAAR